MKYSNIVQPSDYGPIIVSKNDSIIGQSIAKYGYWAHDDIRIIGKIIELKLKTKEKIIFYDVGANIGTHTLALATMFRNKINIRAFEAQRHIYYMLCGTVAINNIYNTTCHHNAVSDVDGESLDIVLPNYTVKNNFGALELRPPKHSDNQHLTLGETAQLTTVTIDRFREAVDVIKFDIEGMEDAGIRGATQTIRQHRPACIVEMHKTDAAFVLDFFKNEGYSGWMKSENLIALPVELNIVVQGLTKIF